MDNSRNSKQEAEQPADDKQTEEEIERPASGYYYDDSTGYETYEENDENQP